MKNWNYRFSMNSTLLLFKKLLLYNALYSIIIRAIYDVE